MTRRSRHEQNEAKAWFWGILIFVGIGLIGVLVELAHHVPLSGSP